MTQHWPANTIIDLIRTIFSWLDMVVYYLLGLMYQILFNIASWDVFSTETVRNFYGRIQLILGVFMIFRLAITIIQGIINPNTFTDQKSGIGNIITRIVFALIMLTVLTPINIPGATSSYEININNNGLLFGTLYELQDRILANNTLGRLILGTTDNATTSSSDDETLTGSEKQGERFSEMSDVFTSTILKAFVRINMKYPEDAGVPANELDETNPDHRMCEYISQETLDVYTRLDASPNQILTLINASCETEGGWFSDILGGFKRMAGTDRYVFFYLPIVSTLVGAFFIYILLGEIITIAIRSLKLAVLRVIAPIPIISYIQPSKDNASFDAWTKALTSTYLELFIHLAVIYFILFLVQDLIVNGIALPEVGGMVGVFSFIFILVGLFYFIKMAPKFIMNAMGMKGDGGNIGIGAVLAATGAIRQGGNLREVGEAFRDSARGYTAAYDAGKAPLKLGQSFEAGRDHVAKILTGDNNMTGRMMSRGKRHLDAMGIDRYTVDKADQAKKNAATAVANLKDMYTRYTDGHMGAHELSAFESNADNATKIRNYEKAGYTHDEAIGRAMYDALSDAETAATKAAKQHEKMEGMQKKYGQARSYEAKYASNRGNRAVISRGSNNARDINPDDPYPNGRVQAWREQYVKKGTGDSGHAESPLDSGRPDVTPPGATTPGGGHGPGPGGHGPRP